MKKDKAYRIILIQRRITEFFLNLSSSNTAQFVHCDDTTKKITEKDDLFSCVSMEEKKDPRRFHLFSRTTNAGTLVIT